MNPLALSVPEAARLLGIGKTSMYELISSGAIVKAKIGRRTVIPFHAVEAFLQKHTS